MLVLILSQVKLYNSVITNKKKKTSPLPFYNYLIEKSIVYTPFKILYYHPIPLPSTFSTT